MARNYRNISKAEERLHAATGIINECDTTVPSSAWYALGRLHVLLADALELLGGEVTAAKVNAYVDAAEAMQGYVQDALPVEA